MISTVRTILHLYIWKTLLLLLLLTVLSCSTAQYRKFSLQWSPFTCSKLLKTSWINLPSTVTANFFFAFYFCLQQCLQLQITISRLEVKLWSHLALVPREQPLLSELAMAIHLPNLTQSYHLKKHPRGSSADPPLKGISLSTFRHKEMRRENNRHLNQGLKLSTKIHNLKMNLIKIIWSLHWRRHLKQMKRHYYGRHPLIQETDHPRQSLRSLYLHYHPVIVLMWIWIVCPLPQAPAIQRGLCRKLLQLSRLMLNIYRRLLRYCHESLNLQSNLNQKSLIVGRVNFEPKSTRTLQWLN